MALTDQSTQTRAGEELDVALIDPYLKASIPSLSGIAELPQISQFPGGASNLTYLLQYPSGVRPASTAVRPESQVSSRHGP